MTNRHFRRHSHVTTGYIRLNTHLCQACWECVEACPRRVLGKVDLFIHKHARIDQASACIGCQKCVKACPNGAILVIKQKFERISCEQNTA